MAAETFVAVVANKIGDLLINEAISIVGVRDQVDRIRTELHWIHSFLADAEGKQEHREDIKEWVDGVRNVANEAEDILETWIAKTERRKKRSLIKRYTFIFNDRVARLNFIKEIKRIDTHVHSIFDAGLKYGFNATAVENSTNYEGRKTQSFILNSDICGLEEDLKTLESRLVSMKDFSEGRRKVISIVGMGGIGKTTLAHAVYNSQVVQRHFKVRVWICVSQHYTKRQLLDDTWASIMHSSSVDVDVGLYNFLKDKRYLIVLDDVWDVGAWEFLSEYFPYSSIDGSRVLLTTRNKSLALEVDSTSPPHEMKFLSLDNCWILFLKMFKKEENYFSPGLIEVGKQIVKKCGGLPLAIKVIGALLYSRDETVEDWSRVLNDVSSSSSLHEIEDSLLGIFELSYKDLAYLYRPLFLYFLVFPKEYEIPVRRLFGLWLAEGIMTQEDEDISWEDLAQKCLNELIDRNMIQVVRLKLDGKPKTCRLVGGVRDSFLSKACDIGIFHIHRNISNSPPQPSFDVRRLVEYTDINDHSSLEHSIRKSRSYISFNFRKGDIPAEATGRFLGSVIQRGSFGLLRVLDLERVYKPKLPQSLGKLLHLLKYLGLRWTFLDVLPSSVGALSFLETLDVKHTFITNIPISIWKLENMRHLYLNEYHLNMSAVRIALRKLHTLWGLSFHMDNPVTNSLYSLITFKKLGLTYTYQGETSDDIFAKWISRLEHLETLRLRSIDKYGRPSNLMLGSFSSLSHLSNLYLVGGLSLPLSALELPGNLTVLTLSVSRLEQDPMPILGMLPKLRALRLFAQSYIGKKMVCSGWGFRSLRVLKLWMLEELEEWFVMVGAMINLEELEIRCCKRLKEVPQQVLQLASFRALILTNMSEDFRAKVELEIEKVEVENPKDRTSHHVSLTVNNWEFPTFADQVTSLGGESSG